MIGILLAAGRSARMGEPNKLLEPWGTGSVVDTVWTALHDAGLERVLVVVGHDADSVRRALPSAELLYNDRCTLGMGTSIATGVLAAGSADGYLVALGDMPAVSPTHFQALLAALDGGRTLAVSEIEGRWGPPVAFAARYRDDLCALSGDEGAHSVLTRYKDQVMPVKLDLEQAADLDTPADFKRAAERSGGR